VSAARRDVVPVNLAARLAQRRVIVCCGSGGVGKTTVSAALAMALVAERDLSVLVLTVDPARRLAAALGLGAMGAEPVAITPAQLRAAGIEPQGKLAVAMLDVKSAWDRMVERYAPDRATAGRILGNRLYRGLGDAFVGSNEYMALEALYELDAGGEYDCIVVDTPPSRNALDLLESPDRLVDFVGARLLSWLSRPTRFGLRAMNLAGAPLLRMADRLLGAEMLAELVAFADDVQGLYGGVQERAREVYALLRSPASGFVVVTTLEPPALAEAEYFCGRLRELSMPLRGVVVNRILPPCLESAGAAQFAGRLADDDDAARAAASELEGPVGAADVQVARRAAEAFLALHRRAQREVRQLGRLRRFGGAPVVHMPLSDGDVSDLGSLAVIARRLRGGG
jgi:anion-transporting  ArsA/GET3 family ATPase